MNLFKTILVFIALSITILSHAQIPPIDWQKSYGGSNAEGISAMQQTTDGGFIAVGSTNSTDGDASGFHGGNADYWVVKTSSAGTIEWQSAYGGSSHEYATAVLQSTEGGYVVVGYSASNDGDVSGNHGNYDHWVIKITDTGILEWQISLGGSDNDRAYALQQGDDGNYIIGGDTESTNGNVSNSLGFSDGWIVSLTQTGNIAWTKCVGGASGERIYAMDKTAGGGYVVTGYTYSNDGQLYQNHANGDFWIATISAEGNLVSQRAMGGGSFDISYAIKQTTDQGFILAGSSESYDGDVLFNDSPAREFWIVKLNPQLQIQWQRCIGGYSLEEARSIALCSDNGYIVAGKTQSYDMGEDVSDFHGVVDAWIVKLDSSGNIEWEKSYGGTSYEDALTVHQTTDGGYVFGGTSTAVNGDVTINHGQSDFWIVKLEGETMSVNEIAVEVAINVFPNPCTSTINFEINSEMVIEITDLGGRTVYSQVRFPGNNSVDVSGFSKGIYFLNASGKKGVKFVKL